MATTPFESSASRANAAPWPSLAVTLIPSTMKSNSPALVSSAGTAAGAGELRTRTSIAGIEGRIVRSAERLKQFWVAIAEDWTRVSRPASGPPFARLAPGGVTGALAACVVAALFARIFRGFTVDDALVTARVASHWASGQGYRFNTSGPEVDAVTPLGWAHLLGLFGPASPLVMLERARVLSEVAWLVAAAVLGALTPRSIRSRATLL